MEYEHFIDDSTNELCIKLESDLIEAAYEIVNLAQHVKKPVASFGGINNDCAFVWFRIPLKKRETKMTSFDNESPGGKRQ